MIYTKQCSLDHIKIKRRCRWFWICANLRERVLKYPYSYKSVICRFRWRRHHRWSLLWLGPCGIQAVFQQFDKTYTLPPPPPPLKNCSSWHQRKFQRAALLAVGKEIPLWLVYSTHKGSVILKSLPCHAVILKTVCTFYVTYRVRHYPLQC